MKTKTYRIKINGAEVEEWRVKHGCVPDRRWAKAFRDEKVVQSETLTLEQVQDAVKELLHHSGDMELDSINEEYFLFARLETTYGDELTDKRRNGYYVTYAIWVEQIMPIKANEIGTPSPHPNPSVELSIDELDNLLSVLANGNKTKERTILYDKLLRVWVERMNANEK